MELTRYESESELIQPHQHPSDCHPRPPKPLTLRPRATQGGPSLWISRAPAELMVSSFEMEYCWKRLIRGHHVLLGVLTTTEAEGRKGSM